MAMMNSFTLKESFQIFGITENSEITCGGGGRCKSADDEDDAEVVM